MGGDQIVHLQDLKERLPNLQLLEGPDNISKSDRMPAEWIVETFKADDDRKDYIARHLLDGVMTDLSGFEGFYNSRRVRLISKIRAVLNATAEAEA